MQNFDTIVSVIVAAPIDKPFDYITSEPVCCGQFVMVPLGGRTVAGIVCALGTQQDRSGLKLKRVDQVLPFEPLHQKTLMFMQRAAGYTMAPVGMFARLMTSVPGLEKPMPKPEVIVASSHQHDNNVQLTEARLKVLTCVKEHQISTIAELARRAGVGASVVTGLLKHGVLERKVLTHQLQPLPNISESFINLSDDQRVAADGLCNLIPLLNNNIQTAGTTLLQGVTGSGKTEVYLDVVAKCLMKSAEMQVVIMVPEIALSASFSKRLEERFGRYVRQWHSGLSPAQRRMTWEGINTGKIRLVVGARSALFLPYRHLGLIIIDEEHDTGFKQEDVVLYNARDMAVLYGNMHNIPVVLSSATPSLETWVNAQSGKYTHIILSERFGVAVMPEIRTIDLRQTKLDAGRWISAPLREAVHRTLAAKEQALLFLNRRGYAPLTLCRTCGHHIECRQCSAWLVEHRAIHKMICHQCGQQSRIPVACPACQKPTLAACGPGIERLEEETRLLFPEARIAILSSDLFVSTKELQQCIHQIAQGQYDIIIGTQLVTKGYTFPLLTLVGVIDADLGLQGADMRAAERTFQVLQQVAGRAGRVDKKGVAFLQTTCPDHPVMQALLTGEVEKFWQTEAQQRRAARVPPYCRIAGIIISGKYSDQVWAVGRALAQTPIDSFVDVLGPAQAPVGLLRGKHRVRLLLRAPRHANLQNSIKKWMLKVKVPSSVRVVIDIDPQSFM